MHEKLKIKKTRFHSQKIGSLPKGCKQCVRGEKLVLFITGLCERSCFYCPLSEEKKNKDVMYANEWDTDFKGEFDQRAREIILKEARLCESKGAGITGGDPLIVVERTAQAIKTLKEEFGEDFHTHLYTIPESLTNEKLDILSAAGLDELRLHPRLRDPEHWDKIKLAAEYPWSLGLEVPAVPGYGEDMKKLIDYAAGLVKFININELEVADTPANRLLEMGYETKDDESYAVLGSRELAEELMEYVIEKKYLLRVHFCTAKLKDAVQMAQRIKKRAKNAAYGFDQVTKEGMLLRGVMYLKELKPDFSYRRKLKELKTTERADAVVRLRELKDIILSECRMKGGVEVDEFKLRLLCSAKSVKKHKKEIKKHDLIPAVVEEYPTRDGLELDIEFL